MGLREEREFRIDKSSKAFRIAVLGDSYTMGSGIQIQDTYPKLLEKFLNQDANNPDQYEVINFGVGGYSLRQYAAVIQHKVLKFDPDLILIGWCAKNDQQIFPENWFRAKYNVLPRESGFLNSYFVELLKHVRKSRKELQQEVVSEKSGYTPDKTMYIASMFERIQRLADHTPVVIAYLGFHELKNSALERLAKSHDLYFVDAVPAFKHKNHRDYVLHLLDEHPNAKANTIFSEVIYQYLLERALLGKNHARKLDAINTISSSALKSTNTESR